MPGDLRSAECRYRLAGDAPAPAGPRATRTLTLWVLLSLLYSMLPLASPVAAAEIRISVAASMTDAAKSLIEAYRAQTGEVGLYANFAASGSLAKQIAEGAPADIFISANPGWMTYLVDTGLVPAEQVRDLAQNRLVLVGNQNVPIDSLPDVVRLGRIAIGSPKSVPAGQYTVQALKAAGIYEQLQGRLVLAKDVRQALIYADRGETDGAFVYRTDALLAREAVILLEVPQALYGDVTYPVALTVEGLNNPAAQAFFAYLQSPRAKAILSSFGFIVK